MYNLKGASLMLLCTVLGVYCVLRELLAAVRSEIRPLVAAPLRYLLLERGVLEPRFADHHATGATRPAFAVISQALLCC